MPAGPAGISRSQHLKVRQAVWMVMVMVGELDRIGDHGPSSAVDEEEEDVDLATTMHQFSLTLSEVQHWHK